MTRQYAKLSIKCESYNFFTPFCNFQAIALVTQPFQICIVIIHPSCLIIRNKFRPVSCDVIATLLTSKKLPWQAALQRAAHQGNP